MAALKLELMSEVYQLRPELLADVVALLPGSVGGGGCLVGLDGSGCGLLTDLDLIRDILDLTITEYVFWHSTIAIASVIVASGGCLGQ